MTSRKDDDDTEYDVDEDENVAGSRAGKQGGDDGTYVGETGAEARDEQGGE
jgi:hypothetical protein